MKLKRIIFGTFLFMGFIMSCNQDDDTIDTRELVSFPIYPNQQIDELNKKLKKPTNKIQLKLSMML